MSRIIGLKSILSRCFAPPSHSLLHGVWIDNLRGGQSLGFAEQIRINRVFGQMIYPGPYHQAAAYLYYIVKHHSFNDGNKRTGLAAALTVLEWNGLPYRTIQVREGEVFVNSVATSKLDPGEEIERISSWLDSRPSKPRPRHRR